MLTARQPREELKKQPGARSNGQEDLARYEMIKITIKVSNEAGRSLVAVCAESIAQAVKRVEDVYGAMSLSVVFPLNPEKFFSDDDAEAALEELEFSGRWPNAG